MRNKVWLFTRSRGLSPLEKVVYGGATLARWVRTVAGSSDRRTLLAGLARGLPDGSAPRPRPTDQVLAEIAAASGRRAWVSRSAC